MKINGKDCMSTWGVRMGDGFIDSIETPAPAKDIPENKSAQLDGKTVYTMQRTDGRSNKIRYDERDVTLTFTISAETEQLYRQNKESFMNELTSDVILLEVPEINSNKYRLIYRASASFAMSTDRTFSKISIKFNEPNPTNRGVS